MRMLVLNVPLADAELAADRLWIAGARAVEECHAATGFARLRTVLADSDSTSLCRLGVLAPTWTVTFEDADDVAAESWREFAQPIRVNDSLVIRPAWHQRSVEPGIVEIGIEPGGSFGLGDHPTTRLSADAVWRLVRPGDRVLDVGCGSGVLSIVAALRGADRVRAIDVSEAAREAAIDNARQNRVGDRIDTDTAPIEEIAGSFDIVVANILAPVLVSMAADFRRLVAPSGCLVVSGVLADRHEHVLAALEPMCVVGTSDLDGWSLIELRHSAVSADRSALE
jgi:ribosomal protein L11 methyltransferase